MRQVTAARFEGEGRIAFQTEELGPRPGELARVRVEACALCGSDKRLLRSGAAVTPGHEIVGVVEELPADAAGLRIGDRVLVYIPLHCGQCAECTAGRTNRCLRLERLIGWQAPGGFAEILDLPVRNLIAVPPEFSPTQAVLALDTIGTTAHGLRMAARALGGLDGPAVVVGCGPLGLGAVATLRAMGARSVHATDPVTGRLDVATRLGAAALPQPKPRREFPLVIEASGAAPARQTALELVRPGGAVLLLGESNDPLVMPATPDWRRTDAFYIRSFYFPLTEVADNFRLLAAVGAALAAELCTPHPFPELQRTFERFVAGELVKPVVFF
ncbi:MAG TPA: alcohol dehydrogenase catalytic domain-containing protein [Mycobacteriales bacterium]|nr:alcohol dehydrogenase catalytic domain-containing protein [Mycobacteriales bacterium]